MKKCSWCALDLNPRLHDSRRRQYHRAMAPSPAPGLLGCFLALVYFFMVLGTLRIAGRSQKVEQRLYGGLEFESQMGCSLGIVLRFMLWSLEAFWRYLPRWVDLNPCPRNRKWPLCQPSHKPKIFYRNKFSVPFLAFKQVGR